MYEEFLPEEMEIVYSSATTGKKVLKLLNKTQLIFIYSNSEIIEPKQSEWENFWENLEKIGIWDLEENYERCIMIDGYFWEINISHQNQSIHSRGNNIDPTLYVGTELVSILDEFLDAIYDLTGKMMDK
ncbi:MAG: hypothetical protein K1X33_01050 [Methanobacteriaceae archaeon]|nr:hypothetical protein [Methanobacteriaceae archaeon]